MFKCIRCHSTENKSQAFEIKSGFHDWNLCVGCSNDLWHFVVGYKPDGWYKPKTTEKPYKCPLCDEGKIWVYSESLEQMSRFIKLGYEWCNEGMASKDCHACKKGILWK